MYTIVAASQKGGSGKTTLSGHLAVEASRAGQVEIALIDTDPQGSLAHWWNARQAPEPRFVKAGLPDLDHFRQTLFHELEAELEGALGECPDRIRRRMLGWPDPETSTPARDPKAKESKRIEHQYHPELSTLTRRARHRALTEEERARYAELVAQLRAALAEVLPPDELTEYWYRRSPAATYVIRSLPEAADERQFRAMVDLVEECQMLPDEAEFLRRYAIVGLGPEDARRIEQREATFRRRLEEVMGRRERLEPE